MTKVFKRRVAELAINDMVDLTSCPYLRNQAMAGMVYGVVAHKDVDHPNTVVIGYEGIDHIGYPHVGLPDTLDVRHQGVVALGAPAAQLGIALMGGMTPIA